MYIVVEQTGSIIERIAVQMAHADHYLERVAQGMARCGEICYNETEGAPQELMGPG